MAIEAFRNAQGWKPRMDVIVLKVISPTSFFIREAVGAEMSRSGKEFISMEAEMNQQMMKRDSQPPNPSLPELESIVLVRNPSVKGWYRARVNRILETMTGYQVELFLVDYGETLMVDQKVLRKVPYKRFLEVPFQCVEFSLLGLKPVQWRIDPATITMKYVEGSSWDTASVEYVKLTVQKADAVSVQVLGKTTSEGLFGKLFISCNKNVISLDKELVTLNYAFLDTKGSYKEIVFDDDKPDWYDQEASDEPQSEGSVVRMPVEVCDEGASSPSSISASGASSPLHWSSSSTCISLGTSSSGSDTPPTLPGLGQDLALMLKLRELESDTSFHEPGAMASTDVHAEGRSIAIPSPAEECDEDESYTPTLVGSPCLALREREKSCSPESPGSSPPTMPPLLTVRSRQEPASASHEAVMPQSLPDASQFREPKARGRARLLNFSESLSSSFESSQTTFPRSIDLSSPTKVYTTGTAHTERSLQSSDAAATSESLVPEGCAADVNDLSPVVGLPDLSAYPYAGRGRALLSKFASRHLPGQHVPHLSSQSPSSPRQSLTQEECGNILSHGTKPKSASTSSHNAGTYSSPVVTKASKPKDLLEKKGWPLHVAPLQSCSSNSQGESLTKFPKPYATTETVLTLKKKDLFAGSSLPCPSNSNEQVAASAMSSKEIFTKLIDASKLNTSYQPDEEFMEPSASTAVSPSSDDFRGADFKRFPELPPDLDPSVQFKGAVNFSTDYDSCRLSSQSAFSKVRALCHGILPPRPVTRLDHVPFDECVKSRLRSKGFRVPTCIQSVVWPAVLSGRDIVAVAPPHSGKTLAYLIPLVSRLMSETDYDSLPAGVGPLVLVLTSSWKGASRLTEQAKLLVHEKTGPKVCAIYAGGAEKGKEIEMVNGCHILVATPHCFLRFLTNYDRLIVNLRRCCHLVLDDGERLLDKFSVEVTSVMNEFRQCTERRRPGLLHGQIIVCSTMWSSGLNWFIRMSSLSKTPLIMFTTFFEAAIYAQVPTVAHYEDPLCRQLVLLRIVEGNRGRKVVVCTATRQSAISVHRFLFSCCVNCLLLHDDLTMAKTWEVTSEWNTVHPKAMGPVLVAQDNMLPLANIRDASVLIHYDIPEVCKHNFGFRFSCLADRMRSFNDKDSATTAEESVAHMILSRNNRNLCVQLVEFLKRLGANVPDGLMRLAAEKDARVSRNPMVALCPNLKAFGHCEKQTAEKCCSYRHQLLRAVDHSQAWADLPSQGQVLIVVTKVVTAARFYAWILQHWDTPPASANERKSEPKENMELQNAMMFLNDFFSKPSNLKHVDANAMPKVGQVYGLEHSVGHFRRVLVTSVLPKSSAPAAITVSYMDYGGQQTVAASKLLLLPPELAKLRPFAVEVYCCRVQPQDCDIDWTFQAVHKAHELVFRKELLGKIVLRLGNTLWLDPLVLWENLPFVDAKVPLKNVRTSLIEERLACDNPTHVQSLHIMAGDAGVPIPIFTENNKERDQNDRPSAVVNYHCTAFLDMHEFNHVYLWKVTSPSHFYIQPVKFNSCLEELEDNIQTAMKKMELPKLKFVHPGAMCIARYNNDCWYRGEVQEVLSSGEVVVFFPDYGDTVRCHRDELFQPLSWMMLLPYQGIQCSLAGISSPSEKWSPVAQSVLDDFGYDDNNMNRQLCLRVVKKIAGERPGTSCYEVLLFNSCHEGRVSAADLLVKRGLAVSTTLPKLNFDTNLPHATASLEEVAEAYDTDSDEDGEEVTLECQKKLEEHMYGVFGEVRDQILAPAAAELMQELSREGDMLGQGNTCCQPLARRAEVPPPELHKQSDRKDVEEVKPAKPQGFTRDCLPLLESQFKTEHSRQASILWWQDDCFVYVDIMIANIKEYKLDVTAKMFCIRFKTAEHEYLAHEMLYAAIAPNKARLVQKVDSLRITLQKSKAKHTWKFLTRNERKVQYIHYHLDHIDVSDDENEIVKACKAFKDPHFKGYKRPAQILPYDPVAHEERAREIEAGIEDIDDDLELQLYFSIDPNNIFDEYCE